MNDDRDYVGVAPCGCAKILCSAKMDKKELSQSVAKMVRLGLSIERMTKEEIIALTMHCAMCRPVRQPTMMEDVT